MVKYPPNKGTLEEERATEDFMRSVFNDAYAMLFSVFFIESYVVDTCLNCLDLSRQFK